MAINILPVNIANQIAAGEVVNRPASAVKELMENAIDAGATDIALIITDAGRTLVEVVDNGCGMSVEDAPKSFLPHATSKIQKEEDLRNLHTMGFRGEALASIAAIAQVEMRTKRAEDELGQEIVIEGGEIKSISQITSPVGTDIKVKNIFYNVPARRNFLKSDATEKTNITDAFICIALIYNNVSFKYISDNNVVFKLEKSTQKKRIVDIFGSKFNSNLLPIEEKLDLIEISGFISTITLTKKNKADQYFFVNGRFMKNPYFANAVDRAYQNLIPPKNFPIFFISLKVNPKDIDVNIHPTKTEIKFVDDKMIYNILNATVRKALGQNTLNTMIDFETKDDKINFNQKANSKTHKISYSQTFNPFAKNLANPSFDFVPKTDTIKQQTEIAFADNPIMNKNKEIANSFVDVLIPNVDMIAPQQYLSKYIVTQINNIIYLISQAKASKKIIYEHLLGKTLLKMPKDKLLIPLVQKFSPFEVITLTERSKILESIGFEFVLKDKVTVEFTFIPANLTTQGAMNIVEDIINETIGEEERYLLVAEKLAIKNGKVLKNDEIRILVNQLLKCDNPEFLPMNERVFIRLDDNFLQRFFF